MSQTLRELGEFALIERLLGLKTETSAVILGNGDDAAVLRLQGDAVISTDTMVADVHYKTSWSAPFDVGRKAVASALADLEAMGAKPIAVVVALTAPSDTQAEWIMQLRDGIGAECEHAQVALVGGDVSSGLTTVITSTVLGDLAGREACTRSGAQHGNVIAYCGNLGMAEAGLRVLQRGFRSPAAVVSAHRVPQVPYGQGAVAVAAGATAMIDISDGLVVDLTRVAKASGMQLQLKTSLLIVDPAQQTVADALGGADPLRFILEGGDDHGLVATFPPESVPPGWRIIGQVATGTEPGVLVDDQLVTADVGWEHFRS